MRQLSNRLARLLRIEHWQLIMIYLIIYDVIAVNGAFFLALWLRFDLRFTMISGNYLIVKNINLSYSLPRKFVNSIGLAGVSFSASVDNLWSFTAMKGLNPQQSFSGAVYGYTINTPRVGTLGVKVNF